QAGWETGRTRALVRVPGQALVEIPLRAANGEIISGEQLCAIAMIENDKGSVKLTNSCEFFADHFSMDQAYKFNLRWITGEKEQAKSPVFNPFSWMKKKTHKMARAIAQSRSQDLLNGMAAALALIAAADGEVDREEHAEA